MPTNPQTRWRLELAGEIGQKLQRIPGIRAIVVGGSAARGYADEYSDLELPIFWDTLPTDETRLQIAAVLGAEFLYPYSGPANEDNLLIHGFQVDLWHNSVANEDRVIESILQDFNTDLGDSNFMDTIRACIPLYGEEIIRGWKEKAAQYPQGLAARNIQQAMDQMEAAHPVVLARRQNPTLLYDQISDLQKQVFLILLALNRQYFPTYKWIYPVLEKLALKPRAVEDRFRRAYTLPMPEAAADTAAVVEETLQLVRERFPELDIAPARNRMRFTRPAHAHPIHLEKTL